MGKVTPTESATPRRTLFAAGRWPERDAMERRSDAITKAALPFAADVALAQLYRTVSRCVRMVDTKQVSADVALVFIGAALTTFDNAVDERTADTTRAA